MQAGGGAGRERGGGGAGGGAGEVSGVCAWERRSGSRVFLSRLCFPRGQALLRSRKMLGRPCALHVYYAFPPFWSSWLKKIFVLFLRCLLVAKY